VKLKWPPLLRQLLLFDDEGARSVPQAPRSVPPAPGGPVAAPVPAPVPKASQPRARPPAPARPAALPPLAEPAERCLRLDGRLVTYRLRRAPRRTIGFVIGPQGLEVRAPRGVGIGEIEAALGAKATWIVKKLADARERADRAVASRLRWEHGETLPFLGRPVRLVLDAGAPGTVLEADGAAEARLRLPLPRDAEPARVRDTVQAWLQRQARRLFEERVAIYAPRLAVQVRRLALSDAGTRWGSACADGSIRLHWRLVHFSLPVIDYVVAHELAHLREMNHGPRFWRVVESVVPDVDTARRTLRQAVLPAFG
jgi:predicted metal-dependent hydrolase